MLAALASVMLAAGPCPAAQTLLVTFDADRAERNDWGAAEPTRPAAWKFTSPGSGCPANPDGRALDVGYTDGPSAPKLAFPLAPEADLRQGTVEFWLRPRWGAGERAIHMLWQVKLVGGHWNSLGMVYHGTIGADSEAFGANIMDGLDHPAYVSNAREMGWKPDEWHHIAYTWTDHTEYVFVDGRLVAQVQNPAPFRIRNNTGELMLGAGFYEGGPTAAALLDEFRLCNVPLYSPDNPPDPALRVGEDLGIGPMAGAVASAETTSEPQALEGDVPELHDGRYGPAPQVGLEPGRGSAIVHLPAAQTVSALEWSREGVPYAGPEGQGWAAVLPYPLAFTVETSADGVTWEPAVRETDFRITPEFVATHEALRFRHDFSPRSATQVRLVLERGPRGEHMLLLDEVAVYGPEGGNLAREPKVRVETDVTALVRRYDPALAVDGRWGEESCWKSGTPGAGVLAVALPELATIRRVTFSRSREGLATDGTPSAGRVEVSIDGRQWQAVGGISGDSAKARTVEFGPVDAKLIRLVITATTDGREAVIDDLRLG